MNNKGFAVTGIIYSILILFISIIAIMLFNLQNKKILLDKLKVDVADNVDSKMSSEIYTQNLSSVILNKSIKKTYQVDAVFDSIASDSDSGLCLYQETDNEDIYFYRGSVNNNYLTFAGYSWRILRLNSDNSIRIILDEPVFDNGNAFKWQTNDTSEDYTASSNYFLYENSNAYSVAENWYIENLSDYEDSIVSTDFYEGSEVSNTVSDDGNYYSSTYNRVVVNKKPSFKTGRKMTRKIGLLSFDEVVLAGGYFGVSNPNYFLFTNSNTLANYMATNSIAYTTGTSNSIFVTADNTSLNAEPKALATKDAPLYIRPVISLSSDTKVTGSGTSDDPYLVQ